MTTDCFGNATPGIPPSISDTAYDIERYAHAPLSQRMEYHYARTDALIGRRDPADAWAMLRKMDDARPWSLQDATRVVLGRVGSA